MGQTKEGAIKSRDTIYARHGKNYFRDIGRLGGSKTGVAKGFAVSGKAVEAGRKGGTISRRGKAKSNV